MNEGYEIRCPVCLAGRLVDKKTPLFQEIRCEKCHRSFEFRNALAPARKHHEVSASFLGESGDAASIGRSGNQSLLLIMILVGFGGLVAFVWACIRTHAMDGPSFLFFFFKVFLLTFLGSLLIRFLLLLQDGVEWEDLAFFKWVGLVFFEGLAIYRLLWGFFHELHKFGFLALGMLLGGAIYFLSLEKLANRSGGGSRGSGCSGGCSGGCGGGCGGCGD